MATNELLPLLILEDDPGIRLLQTQRLTRAGFRVTACESIDEARPFLRTTPVQLLILDYELVGEQNGLEFYEYVLEAHPGTPAILVTGHSDHKLAIEAIRLGVRDVIPKTPDYLDYLPLAVSRVLAAIRNESDLSILKAREEAAEEIRIREERYRSLVTATTSIVWTADRDGAFIEPQPEWGLYTGMEWDDYRGWGWLKALHPDDRQPLATLWRDKLQSHAIFEARGRLWHAESGQYRHFVVRAAPVVERDDSIREWVGAITDIEDRVLADSLKRELDEFATRLVQNSPDCIMVLDLSGKITFTNARARELLECRDLDILLDRSITELWPEASRADINQALAEAVAGSTADFQGKCPTMLGTPKWWDVRLGPLLDATGKPEKLLMISRDITERKKAEDALRESEARFHLMADRAPVLIWLRGIDKSGTWFNKAWLDFTGRTLEQEQGAEWKARVHADDLADFLQVYDEAVDSRREFSMEHRMQRHDGEFRWFLATGVPLYGWLGEFEGYIGSCADITERKELDTRRVTLLASESHARSEAERSNRLKDEFLAILSHELRTPLNAILGWTQLIRRNPDPAPDKLAEALEIIERNARVQTKLIDDMLDMSRIMSGKLRLDRQPQDLAIVMRAAIDNFLPLAAAKRIRLETAIDPHVGMANMDNNRIQQVISNLLSNAIKFTPEGGIVTVSLAREGEDARVQVTDTGAGIKSEFLPHVFDRFHQGDASTTRRHGGLGLGLAIVRELIEMHGGAVGVASEGEGKGSAFTIHIPLSHVTPATEVEDRLSERNAVPVNINGIRVLVVDDQPDARALLRQILIEWGADVLEASSAAEALAAIQAQQVDLLVSDIAMPERDGFDLIRDIRKLERPEHRSIPAIAVSAFAHAEDRRRALQAGFQMHVPKPIDPDEIVMVVAILAERVSSQETS